MKYKIPMHLTATAEVTMSHSGAGEGMAMAMALMLVASSGGNITTTAVVDGKPVTVGLNAYIANG